MELNAVTNTVKEEMGKNSISSKTVKSIFEESMQIGKYHFRIKKMKGKKLFTLCTVFGAAGEYIDISNMDIETAQKRVFSNFIDAYDIAMESLEYSLDEQQFMPLVVNGVYQIPEVETNIALMYNLMFFVYLAIMVFMSTSQRLLDDMK